MKRRIISTHGMEAIYCCDEKSTPGKAIILLAGSRGGYFSAHHEGFLEAVVSIGYTVLDLAYFRKGKLPRRLRKIPLEYFESALDWLSRQPEVTYGQYAVMGVSKGAELALVLASRYVEFKAVVALVPANVVFQGIGLPYLAGSSWSYGGEDLPCVPFALWPWLLTGGQSVLTGRFRYLYASSLRNGRYNKETEIPAECIGDPILLISSARDSIWPSKEMCKAIMSRLSEHNCPHHYEHVVLDAPHWVMSSKACRQHVLDFLGRYFPVERQQ